MKWLSNIPKKLQSDYDVCTRVRRKTRISNGKKVVYDNIRIRFASNAYGAFKHSKYIGFSVPTEEGRVYLSHGQEKSEIECLKLYDSTASSYAMIQDAMMARELSCLGNRCFDMKYDYNKKLYYIALEEGVEL